MIYLQEGLGEKVETVEAGGDDVKNPFYRVEKKLSVVQTSVEVTESSLLPDVVIVRISVTRDRFS